MVSLMQAKNHYPHNARTEQTLPQNKTINLIQILTALLVFLVALGSFTLSYNALQDIALSNGIIGRLSYIWPLLIDFALIVFSLSVVNAYLQGQATWKQWGLVGLYTLATIGFNILHAPDTWQARIVAGIAPVSLFFSFEFLMGQLRNTIKRQGLGMTIDQLNQQMTSLRLDLSNLEQEIIRQQQTAQSELETLTQRIESHKAELSELQRAKRVAKQASKPAKVSKETRDIAFTILAEWEGQNVNLNRKGAQLAREMSQRMGRKIGRKTGFNLLNGYQEMGTDSPKNGNGTPKTGSFDRLIDPLPMDKSDKQAPKNSKKYFVNGERQQ
jgi:TolA-binding protein